MSEPARHGRLSAGRKRDSIRVTYARGKSPYRPSALISITNFRRSAREKSP